MVIPFIVELDAAHPRGAAFATIAGRGPRLFDSIAAAIAVRGWTIAPG